MAKTFHRVLKSHQHLIAVVAVVAVAVAVVVAVVVAVGSFAVGSFVQVSFVVHRWAVSLIVFQIHQEHLKEFNFLIKLNN